MEWQMASKQTDDIAELYAQLDAAKGNKASNDPVKNFIKTANAQINKVDELIAELASGKDLDNKLVPQSDWFFRSGAGWVVKFGRSKFKTPNGTEWFNAEDLEGVKSIINIGIKLAQVDSGFKDQIKAAVRTNAPASNASTADKPKRGRRPKNA
jgi:hypothetical protein